MRLRGLLLVVILGLVMHLSIKSRVFNDKFIPYVWDDTPTQIFFGGSSSGKSIFTSDRMILGVVRDSRNVLVVRNVAKTLRSSCFAELRKSINKFHLGDAFAINKADMEMTCTANDAQILFRGLDDIEKLKSVTALSGPITDVWIEEGTEISEEALNQIFLRLRGRAHVRKRVILTFNPINRQHWIVKRFFGGYDESNGFYRDGKLLIVHSTHWDNRFLTGEDHERIESFKDIDPYYYDVYGLGKWGVLGDLIFRNWETRDLSGIKDNLAGAYRYGIDFGFSNDPTAVVRVALKDGIVYVLDEVVQRELTNRDIADQAKPIVGNGVVWCDCAEPKSIRELTLEGVNARPVSKGRDSVLHGIQWLQQRKLVVDTSCQHTINELGTYQWRKDKYGEAINDPVDANNHCIDAIRYALERDMQAIGSLIKSSAGA